MEKPSHLPPGVKKTILMNHLEGRDSHDKGIYLQTYFASLDQAYKLLEEAELLYKNESFHRAFFLGISALEEISKSQMAADVYTGLLNEDHFKSAYKDHKKKISRIEWIRIDGNSFPFFDYDNAIIKEFDFQKKLKSMYVDIDFKLNEISTPDDSVTKHDAKSVITAVKVGLYRIYEITEEKGEQIGTKGFLK